MHKTDYIMIQHGSHFYSYKKEVIATVCFSKEDALHSIWVEEGKAPTHFYSVDEDGVVYLEKRGDI